MLKANTGEGRSRNHRATEGLLIGAAIGLAMWLVLFTAWLLA